MLLCIQYNIYTLVQIVTKVQSTVRVRVHVQHLCCFIIINNNILLLLYVYMHVQVANSVRACM
jgi:hypothetical protein